MINIMEALKARGITPEMLAQMQEKTKPIRAQLLVEETGLRLRLSAPDPESASVVKDVAAGAAQGLVDSLYTLYGIQVEIYR